MRYRRSLAAATIMVAVFLMACQTYQVIPKELKDRVNTQASYEVVKSNPASHQGELVVWGGEVLQAIRLKNMTRFEILQLPLSDDYLPLGERVLSKGRFVAYDRLGESVDPAIVPEGTKVTIVGLVQQPVPTVLEEESKEYPAIEIRDMTLWSAHATRTLDYPYYGPYGGIYYYGSRPYVFRDGTRAESVLHN